MNPRADILLAVALYAAILGLGFVAIATFPLVHATGRTWRPDLTLNLGPSPSTIAAADASANGGGR